MEEMDEDMSATKFFSLTGEAAPGCVLWTYRALLTVSVLAGLLLFVMEVDTHWLLSLLRGAGVSLGGWTLALALCETMIVTGILREAWLCSRLDPATAPWGHLMTETRLDFTDLPRWRMRRLLA